MGDPYTIVDMAAWGWVDRVAFTLKEDAPLDRWPNIKRWFETIDSRPAAARARLVGSGTAFKTEFDEEALRNLFPQNYSKAA